MTGAASLVALAAVGGISMTALASDENSVMEKGRRFFNKQLTDEQKAELPAQALERMEEMKTKTEEVKNAIDAGDYEAWVKAVGEKCPLLSKINKDNFGKYVEAQKLMEQADVIMKDLGIEKGVGEKGFGHFRGLGQNK